MTLFLGLCTAVQKRMQICVSAFEGALLWFRAGNEHPRTLLRIWGTNPDQVTVQWPARKTQLNSNTNIQIQHSERIIDINIWQVLTAFFSSKNKSKSINELLGPLKKNARQNFSDPLFPVANFCQSEDLQVEKQESPSCPSYQSRNLDMALMTLRPYIGTINTWAL